MKKQFTAAKRLYRKHISRFITIMCIVIVSIGFMSGVGEVENKINEVIDKHINSLNEDEIKLIRDITTNPNKAKKLKPKR